MTPSDAAPRHAGAVDDPTLFPEPGAVRPSAWPPVDELRARRDVDLRWRRDANLRWLRSSPERLRVLELADRLERATEAYLAGETGHRVVTVARWLDDAAVRGLAAHAPGSDAWRMTDYGEWLLELADPRPVSRWSSR